jgi:hypothetical protein
VTETSSLVRSHRNAPSITIKSGALVPPLLTQAVGVTLPNSLHVLRTHDDRCARKAFPDLARGAETVVGVAGWHADVGDADIGPVRGDLAHELRCVAGVSRTSSEAGGALVIRSCCPAFGYGSRRLRSGLRAPLSAARVGSGRRLTGVAIFADGEVDRSPTGSATSARTALLLAEGEIGIDDSWRNDSIAARRSIPGRSDRSPTACRRRCPRPPSGPASTASCSTCATRSGPGSSCADVASVRDAAEVAHRLPASHRPSAVAFTDEPLRGARTCTEIRRSAATSGAMIRPRTGILSGRGSVKGTPLRLGDARR